MIKVVITGVTGMVGEGVMLECLANPEVQEVLAVSRRPLGMNHPKLKELIVQDFKTLEGDERLRGYDGCLYCAGVSSIGMSEADYTAITYDTAIAFAKAFVLANPDSVICHISGASTDGTEQGRIMWARVKGRAENALTRLGFRAVYNFRPGFMKPYPGQKQLKTAYRIFIPILYPVFSLFFARQMLTLSQVGQAMINAVARGGPKTVLEIADIRALAEAQRG